MRDSSRMKGRFRIAKNNVSFWRDRGRAFYIQFHVNNNDILVEAHTIWKLLCAYCQRLFYNCFKLHTYVEALPLIDDDFVRTNKRNFDSKKERLDHNVVVSIQKIPFSGKYRILLISCCSDASSQEGWSCFLSFRVLQLQHSFINAVVFSPCNTQEGDVCDV
jgi:hypothetical protein